MRTGITGALENHSRFRHLLVSHEPDSNHRGMVFIQIRAPMRCHARGDAYGAH